MPALGLAPGDEKVYTVLEVTQALKDLIEARFPHVWVLGEMSNHSLHSTGHTYFTLKDESAQIKCVLFRSARPANVVLENGIKVYAQGRLSVYEKQGQYELIVSVVVPAGRGDLYAAFGRLKLRLEKEGLFDPGRKRALPRFPERIGLVTSPTGAAVRDVIRMSRRIFSGVDIIVRPVKVQGDGAGEEIAQAVRDFNAFGAVDVIVLARGGGSIEDLWAFNEEVVARAISSSRIPVVSAVGHEIDFTIADFTADARAATPSAAPEIVLADYVDARARLASLSRAARSSVASRIDRDTRFISSLGTRYGLRRIRDHIVDGARRLDEGLVAAERALEVGIKDRGVALETLRSRLESLNPRSILERGYSLCYMKETGERIRSYRQVSEGDRLKVVFAEGRAVCEVESAGEETT